MRVGPAVLVSLVLALGSGAPVAAQPPNQGTLQAIVLRVEISGPTEVCTNVEYTYQVEVLRYYVQGVTANLTYVAQGSAAATIHVDVAGQSRTGATSVFSGASFNATFPAPGSYTLTASAAPDPALLDTNGMPAAPATATITARSCDFELSTISIWYHLPFGFRPWVGAVMGPVLIRPDAAGSYTATATLRTFAIGSQGPCAATFDVKDVTVTILGAIRSSGTQLAYSLDFSPGTAKTRVECPGPGGVGTAESRDDPFTVDPISGFLATNPLGGPAVDREAPHVFHTLADVRGITYVILEPKP